MDQESGYMLEGGVGTRPRSKFGCEVRQWLLHGTMNVSPRDYAALGAQSEGMH